ncbi:MAG: translation initiation factor IF-2 N-terminal domain-containing protein, partial [Lachnospiraceae bacterium]|nr:translation initiation factor IF-2 N-terminal domain-containing protein [Lachnospiraceae bacterium]
MKVHEIAKELDVQSKDIIAFLNEKGIEVKAAQSALDDDALGLVRKKFGKKEEKKEAPKAEAAEKKAAPAKEQAPSSDSNQEAPKKKKIIFVNNPHNSKMPGQPQGQNRGAYNNNNQQRPQNSQRPQGAKPQGNGQHTISGNAYTHNIIKPRPEAMNRKHPDVEEVAPVKEQTAAPAKNVSVVIEEAPKKEYVQKNNVNKDRNFNKDDRRPQGDRQDRGNRPFNKDGVRPQGDRQFNNNRGDRPFNKDGARQGFSRDGAKPQFDRPARPGQGRSAASDFAAPNISSKPSNDRRDNKSKNNKNFDPTKDGAKNSNRRNQDRDFNKNKNFMMEDDEETLAMKRKKGKFIKPEAKPPVEEEVIKVITLDDTVTIKELAE